VTFLFAPAHHGAMRHVTPIRQELGFRTLFNLLGPLANPARVTRQLTGVFAPVWLRPMAETLRNLGSTDAWIVHGQGLDELTTAGTNQVVALQDGDITEFTVTAAEAGLPESPLSAIAGGDPAHNAASLLALLRGAQGAFRDTVLLNAAAALIVAGKVDSLPAGVALAAGSLDRGAALASLEALKRETA
jgi:anthranilate phosphoribosyltransferase